MSKVLVFFGLYYSDALLKKLESNIKNRIQKAPHNFQKKLISGLDTCDDVTNYQIVIPPLGSFLSASNQLVIHREHIENATFIGYLNLPVWKQCIQKMKVKSEFERILRRHKKDEVQILIYSLYKPYIQAAYELKQKYPCLKVNVLHTDCVPGRDDMDIYMTKRNIQLGNRIVKMAHSFDKFILLSKYLCEPLEVGKRPVMICETLADGTMEASKVPKLHNAFLYAGSISREFQLLDLAKAFTKLQNAELWLCGRSDCLSELEEIMKNHSNIKYFGYLSQQQLKEKMDLCAFLINPRRPSGNYTKYSFPSKTAEYLTSGKPTVMYKLEAIPDEYDQYLNYLTGTDTEQIVDEISNILRTDYFSLLEKATCAREFILQNKTALIQSEKIVKFLFDHDYQH